MDRKTCPAAKPESRESLLVVGNGMDQEVTRLLECSSTSLATVQDYASSAGISPGEFVEQISYLIQRDAVSLETVSWSATTYVRTAPAGRPLQREFSFIGVNCWEALRSHSSVGESALLLEVMRSMESSGWVVAPTGLTPRDSTISPTFYIPRMFARIGEEFVPVVTNPSNEEISSSAGILADLQRAGNTVAVITVIEGELDHVCAAIRFWHRRGGKMTVIASEAPSYLSRVISPSDVGIRPFNT